MGGRTGKRGISHVTERERMSHRGKKGGIQKGKGLKDRSNRLQAYQVFKKKRRDIIYDVLCRCESEKLWQWLSYHLFLQPHLLFMLFPLLLLRKRTDSRRGRRNKRTTREEQEGEEV